MPISKNPIYIKEPTSLQCGQAVLAMLTDKSVDDIVSFTGKFKETTLIDMLNTLKAEGISFCETRKQANKKSDLPDIALLSLETPKCWHWSLYFKGKFLDPEHGVLDDFPICNRKYFWEIKE